MGGRWRHNLRNETKKMREVDYPMSLMNMIAIVVVLFSQITSSYATELNNNNNGSDRKGVISLAVIVAESCRKGKETTVAAEMAILDFNHRTNPSFALQLHLITTNQTQPLRAARAARQLIKTRKVQAILGPHAWEESSLFAEIAGEVHVPLLSFADPTPEWATARWPFLLQAAPTQHAQMEALAAIVQSWGWHRVTLIYEDLDSASDGVIPYLSAALRQVGAEIAHLLPLQPFPSYSSSSSLSEELRILKGESCKVFVVHASMPLAVRLFAGAKEMEMMAKDYVWITTAATTNLVHSIDASAISSMQGVVGIRSYFPETAQRFHNFSKRFRQKFGEDHPEEENHEPGIFAAQAYDAAWAAATALGEIHPRGRGGEQLLETLSSIDFKGLSGEVRFDDRKLPPANVFQIVNVIGRSYRELGSWSKERGFSESLDLERGDYKDSMADLAPVIWPGEPRDTPRGWTLPTATRPMRVGVPTGSSFKEFVNVGFDEHTKNYSYTGFSIEIFKATINRLPYYWPYEFLRFEGTYDDLVEQVYKKKLDAVAGDVSIVAKRYEHAEFTHPYTEPGLVMIVPVQTESSKAWLFLKPFTIAMWALILVFNVYNGFVVWFIERNHCPELKGSPLNQLGTLIWLAFTTLFSLHGEKLHSNLSRMAMVVWLFVAIVITQSYTASLTSMLTVQRLQPAIADVETLKSGNALVGYCRGSFVARYLVEVLGIKSSNIKNFTSPEEYARALRTGEVAAAFLEVPFAKLFLAKYCRSFTLAGPTYKVGGFGFVFPKGSPMLPDIAEALLKVSESGELRALESKMLRSEKCVESESESESELGDASLGLNSFWILFLLSGGTSTVALGIYVIPSMGKLILGTLRQWGKQRRRRFSRRDSDGEIPTNPSNPSPPSTQALENL